MVARPEGFQKLPEPRHGETAASLRVWGDRWQRAAVDLVRREEAAHDVAGRWYRQNRRLDNCVLPSRGATRAVVSELAIVFCAGDLVPCAAYDRRQSPDAPASGQMDSVSVAWPE